MPEYQELTVSVIANQDSELREVVGALVQELDDQYVLVERGNGELNVLRASHLAWLAYGKTLADLEQYFLPAHRLDGTGLTDPEIRDEVVNAAPKVVLLYRDGQFQRLLAAPADLGPGGGDCTTVTCGNCGRRVTLCGNRRICPKCGQYAV